MRCHNSGAWDVSRLAFVSQLPRSTPGKQGVDPAAVLAFVDAVDADPAVELHGVMVLRHGHVVAEGWWAPHTAERTRLLYSISKSFTSTALAFALEEGLVDLDDTAISHFPEFADEITDPHNQSVTLRQLASMASGHQRDMWQEAVARDSDEPVRGFLLAPPEEAPGSVFAYSQPCTYTVAAVIQRRAGMRLSEYLRPRLFDPLGIGEVRWLCWPPGRELGFSGLFARTEDVAKLGQLYLQRGRWSEHQLIPETYVVEATSPRVATPTGRTSTGARATATSSGCLVTATAATAPSASSAWSCRSRMPWSRSREAPRRCRRCWTTCGSTCSLASAPWNPMRTRSQISTSV